MTNGIPRNAEGKVDGGKIYRKGARYERAIVSKAKKSGAIAFRSAGSHSPIDVVIVSSKKRTIELIQAKTGKSLGEESRRNLENKYAFLNGTYKVKFIVI